MISRKKVNYNTGKVKELNMPEFVLKRHFELLLSPFCNTNQTNHKVPSNLRFLASFLRDETEYCNIYIYLLNIFQYQHISFLIDCGKNKFEDKTVDLVKSTYHRVSHLFLRPTPSPRK